MRIVGSYEAKTHLSALREEVAAGGEITTTKRGIPDAQLLPIRDRAEKPIGEVIQAMRAISEAQKLNGLSIREWMGEGRK